MKAIIMNKIGDFALYLALIFCYLFYRSLDFYLLFNVIGFDTTCIYIKIFNLNITKVDIIAVCLVIAAIGKSAQLGLHS